MISTSDVRQLKGTLSEPDQHRVPGRATANERPLEKGEASRGACNRSGADSTLFNSLGGQ